jgi:aerobic C4-dicarboxylate transport protein
MVSPYSCTGAAFKPTFSSHRVILVFSVLFGVALSHVGARGKPVVDLLDSFVHGVFSIVGMIMRLAPIAAFGAIAFTVGKYGLGSIVSLGKLMAGMYITCFLFVVIVLGVIARLSGFSLWKVLKYIKDEIFTVLGTSSSESVVPQLMRKLENAGVAKPVVGLVIPSGLTFNPDGQCIYYTMAAIFIAQATNTPLTFADQLIVPGVLALTSKGSAGVTGSGFITLAATPASLGKIPVAGIRHRRGQSEPFVAIARHLPSLSLPSQPGSFTMPHASHP